MADLTQENGSIPVAIKTMREEISRESRLKFMKEARLMRFVYSFIYYSY